MGSPFVCFTAGHYLNDTHSPLQCGLRATGGNWPSFYNKHEPLKGTPSSCLVSEDVLVEKSFSVKDLLTGKKKPNPLGREGLWVSCPRP